MSRGAAKFQKRLLAEHRGVHGLMPRAKPRKKLPRQEEDHSLHRAVRSSKLMEYIQECELRGQRWIANCSSGFWSEADRELLRLVNTTHRMVCTLAAARGVEIPAIERPVALVDAYGWKRR